MLRGHYIAESTDVHARDGGSFAHEVSVNGTWGTGSRRADVLYAGFTSASGRILVGHELKVSRADWRSELSKLDKADTWADACHAWYVVAPSTDVVPPEELPDGWGLMLPPKSPRGKRMRIEVKAAVKRDFSPPWWAVRSFMARLDTLSHQKRAHEVSRIVKAKLDEREKWQRNLAAKQTLDPVSQTRLEALASIEKMLGVEVTAWRDDLDSGSILARTLAAAARFVSPAGHYRLHSLGAAAKALADAHTQLTDEVLPAMAAPERVHNGGDGA